MLAMHYAGYNNEEIANKLGRTPIAVQVRLNREKASGTIVWTNSNADNPGFIAKIARTLEAAYGKLLQNFTRSSRSK